MENYTLEEKEYFTVLGIGTELKSHYTDFAGINKEKADFWRSVKQDGRLDTLNAISKLEGAVNFPQKPHLLMVRFSVLH